MAAIEKAGFTCEVQERHPDRFVQVADCRSNQDKYRKLIASEWKDPAARDAMYQGRMPGMCGTLGLRTRSVGRPRAIGRWSPVAIRKRTWPRWNRSPTRSASSRMRCRASNRGRRAMHKLLT